MFARVCLGVAFLWMSMNAFFYWNDSFAVLQKHAQAAGAHVTNTLLLKVYSLLQTPAFLFLKSTVAFVVGGALLLGLRVRLYASIGIVWILCVVPLLHPFWLMSGEARLQSLLFVAGSLGWISALAFAWTSIPEGTKGRDS